MGSSVALWNAALVGGAKIIGVFIGMALLDKWMTRRTLLVWGGVTQAAFLVSQARGGRDNTGWHLAPAGTMLLQLTHAQPPRRSHAAPALPPSALQIATAILFATQVPNVNGAVVSKGIAAAILVMIILCALRGRGRGGS